MLILTRRKGESIRIGEEIEVRVLNTGDGSVKLGIIAPGECRVRVLNRGDGSVKLGIIALGECRVLRSELQRREHRSEPGDVTNTRNQGVD